MPRPHPVDGAPQRVAQTVPPSQRAEVYPEYLPPSLPVRHGDLHLHLEPSRTEQCRVEELPPVRHPHHENVGESPDAVELREELVHDRVPRRPARVPAVGPSAEDGVDLVDDDDVQGAVQVCEVLLAGARREAARLELVLGVAEEVPDELLRAADPPVQKLGGSDYLWLAGVERPRDLADDESLAHARLTIEEQSPDWLQTQQGQLLGLPPGPGGGNGIPGLAASAPRRRGVYAPTVDDPAYDGFDLRRQPPHAVAEAVSQLLPPLAVGGPRLRHPVVFAGAPLSPAGVLG
mmetsp:Transcript_15403/g.35553  ORF Transcript_15403/g.35553 Transcript_15403/m.35553 type:complete len:291 (+) Transcript_15403:479-1351(+)